jgi:hypothetical protein
LAAMVSDWFPIPTKRASLLGYSALTGCIGLAGCARGSDVGAVGALAVTNVDCAACDIQAETLGLMTSSENTISRDVPYRMKTPVIKRR